jgi:hypothetical protein
MYRCYPIQACHTGCKLVGLVLKLKHLVIISEVFTITFYQVLINQLLSILLNLLKVRHQRDVHDHNAMEGQCS